MENLMSPYYFFNYTLGEERLKFDEHVVVTDVLVVGGGMAGCFAAIKARRKSKKGRKRTASNPRRQRIRRQVRTDTIRRKFCGF